MTIRDVGNFHFSFSHFFIFISLKFRIYFYNGLHGLYGFFVARGDDGRMQNNPNGRSRRGSKIRIIRAIRCGKTLPKLKLYHFSFK